MYSRNLQGLKKVKRDDLAFELDTGILIIGPSCNNKKVALIVTVVIELYSELGKDHDLDLDPTRSLMVILIFWVI